MQPKRRRSISLGALRVLATLFLLQLLTQVALAALFVGGETELFAAHSLNGSLINALPFALLVTAVLHATVARGVRWPIAAVTLVLLACTVQAALGYVRIIGAHIIGGTLLLSLGVLLCVALWRTQYAPRPSRAERTATDPAGAPILQPEAIR